VIAQTAIISCGDGSQFVIDIITPKGTATKTIDAIGMNKSPHQIRGWGLVAINSDRSACTNDKMNELYRIRNFINADINQTANIIGRIL